MPSVPTPGDIDRRTHGGAVAPAWPNPRRSPAQFLLAVVVAEFVSPLEVPVPTAALLHLMRTLGVREPAVRNNLYRAAEAGWLRRERDGRRTCWTVPRAGREHLRTVEIPETRPDSSWDGTWYLVLLTVPQERRDLRPQVHRILHESGLGTPAAGVWVTPHRSAADRAGARLREVGVRPWIGVHGRVTAPGLDDAEIARRAWPLERWQAKYHEVTTKAAVTPSDHPDASMIALVDLLHEWQRVHFGDPVLPPRLLPAWPTHDVAIAVARQCRRWRPLAHRRWREVVGH